MFNINPEVTSAALFCGRVTFKGQKLTVSVTGRGKGSLIETIFMFAEYFAGQYPDKRIQKLDLFLSESDMHEGKTPFQTTTWQ